MGMPARNRDGIEVSHGEFEWVRAVSGNSARIRRRRHPFVAERESVVDAEHPRFGKIRGVAAPVRVGESLPMRAAPEPGQDNERLLAELGYDAGRITGLRESGVVQ
jgi:hypothetical protein